LLPREGKLVKQKVRKRFRRYVQINGHRRVYFKEYGDPRSIHPNTGMVSEGLALEESATEIIAISRYNPGSPYGLPRWFNQLPAIMGTRQSELTNLDFFSENAIPAMALLISGGMLTQTSLDSMEGHFTAARGRKAMNRILVLEASGDEKLAAPDGGVPIPRVEMKPLQSDRQGDALFQNYEANNRDKVRSAFRLPPIFIGLSNDYTYATAKTSMEVAETQVFAPDRQRLENLLNLKILSTWNPQYWAFRLNPPRLSDPDGVVKALQAFDAMGGLTPNIAISMANQFFNLDIPAVEEDWGDYPFALVMKLTEQGRISFEDVENIPDDFTPPAPAAGGTTSAKPPAAPEDEEEEEEDGAETATKSDVPAPVVAAREALLGLRAALLAASTATGHALKGDAMPAAVRRKTWSRTRKQKQPSRRKQAT
jgi:PBSX family phage portal protein